MWGSQHFTLFSYWSLFKAHLSARNSDSSLMKQLLDMEVVYDYEGIYDINSQIL